MKSFELTHTKGYMSLFQPRIVIAGWPRAGKTTLASTLGVQPVYHLDDLASLGWSEASQAALGWLERPGPWVIEGVAAGRALRKWRDQRGGSPPNAVAYYLGVPRVELTPGQLSMARGCDTVWAEVEPWLRSHGVTVQSFGR